MASEILAQVALVPAEESTTRWRRRRVLSSASDICVMTLGSSRQPRRAVVKLPGTDFAVAGMRREREVLAALHADARLAEWRGLVPTVLAAGEVAGRPYLVERVMPGVAAGRMIGSDEREMRVLAAAASTIGELHRRTASRVRVDEAVLQHWVNQPARIVCDEQASRGAITVVMDRVAHELREALAGRTLPLGWVHGDFVPSNILVSADGEEVSGIVDWESAAPRGLPSIDVVALLLSARAQRQRRELGRVVRELVRGAPWTEYERALLDRGRSALSSDWVESRTLILLWWLQHASANIKKSTRYDRHGLWARWNIHPVLEALEDSR